MKDLLKRRYCINPPCIIMLQSHRGPAETQALVITSVGSSSFNPIEVLLKLLNYWKQLERFKRFNPIEVLLKLLDLDARKIVFIIASIP